MAKGLCGPCYAKQHHAANRDERLAKMRAYNKALRLGLRGKRRPAIGCHPDRPHFAHGLCERCYHQTPHAKALRVARKASTKAKPVPMGAGVFRVVNGLDPRELRPFQRQAVEEARKAKPAFAAVPVGTGGTLVSFFAKKAAK